MTIAILLVAVAILLLQLRNTWVTHDTRWSLNRLEETLDLVDFDVRDIHAEVGASRAPYREQMWRKPAPTYHAQPS
jgi:uncharacterized protein YoxC